METEMEEKAKTPVPTELYTIDEARKFLGGIGKSKMSFYMKKGLVVPIRRRPSLFSGQEIVESMQRIVDYNKEKVQARLAEYGIE